MTDMEYRVVWKRAGLKAKRKRYAKRSAAERFMRLFGPEPWKVYALRKDGSPCDGDDLACCSGRECACGGLTYRERTKAEREQMPALEYVRLESRPVGKWVPSPEVA